MCTNEDIPLWLSTSNLHVWFLVFKSWENGRGGLISSHRTIVANYNKMSTPGLVPKHRLRFIYIYSEVYELDINFYVTKMKGKSDHSSSDKHKFFCENIVVIEGKWFYYMN